MSYKVIINRNTTWWINLHAAVLENTKNNWAPYSKCVSKYTGIPTSYDIKPSSWIMMFKTENDYLMFILKWG